MLFFHRPMRIAAAVVLTLAAICAGRASAEPAILADAGEAKLPIVVSESAPPAVRAAAATLAAQLKRMTGAPFVVTTKNPRPAIVLTLVGDPLAPPRPPFGTGLEDRETYLLRSNGGSLYLVAATELGLPHAVWDLLYRLGHRQFFPGPAWEVVPNLKRAAIDVDAVQRPDYLSRSLTYGWGFFMRGGADRYRDWLERNRMTPQDSRLLLNTAHSYAGLAKDLEPLLKEHPEYLALQSGQRLRKANSQKFCTSNPAVPEMLARAGVEYFEKHPDAMSVSRDPSDLGGWCQCPACVALGGRSNEAVLVANATARAVADRFGPRFVGMYAYSEHSPPPTLRVDKNVVVSVATSFIQGGLTVDQLMEGWAKQGATLGVREYYSVFAWDRNLPGSARASRPDYIRQSIPRFHKLGARFMTAEASENWGPHGLSYYLAARLLWNVNDNADALTSDFFKLAFGPAEPAMRDYFALIDGASRRRFSEDLLGRMYRALARARELAAAQPACLARVNDLVLYTRYLELHLDYMQDREDRQKAFEALARFAWRIRETGMVDAIALWRDLPTRDKGVKIPPEADITLPEGDMMMGAKVANPWKDSTPFEPRELAAFVASGVEHNALLPVEPVSFSEKLVPATKLGLSTLDTVLPQSDARAATTTFGSGQRGTQNYFLWLEKPGAITLKITGGLLYKTRGPVQVTLWADENPALTPVATATVKPDAQEHEASLESAFSGLHRVTIADGSDRTRIGWPEGVPLSAPRPASAGRWSLYFYVPRGTKTVVGFANNRDGTVLGPAGETLFDFANASVPGYFTIPVPAGADGKLWKFHLVSGVRDLVNVPPSLARSAKDLLLPEEVVASDQPAR